MKNISNHIVENPYIRVEKGSAVFLTLLGTTFKNLGKKLNLEKKTYFHVLIKYPSVWPSDLDLFDFIDNQTISKIRNKDCYFIFDASAEGFSPFEHGWFKLIYSACEKYSVDPSQIIFVSSNLKDHDNIEKYCKNTNKQPINIFTFPMFENSCQTIRDAESCLEIHIDQTNIDFKDKYFSSLSRLNRHHRSAGTFLLCQSSVKDQALISHNKLEKDKDNFHDITVKTNYTKKEIKRWSKSLPLIVDRKDFKINWAHATKFDHIHDQTIFQIVNETLVDNFDNTSLFYSEKTFRPISCFQPFVIYGQQGCNHYLRTLGYKTYEDWFDLSFDHEYDYIKRYQKLLTVVEDTCKYLDSMTREKQIAWKFKNQEILIHNAKTMNAQRYTFKKLEKFLLDLDNQIAAHSK